VSNSFRVEFERWLVDRGRDCKSTLELIDGLCWLLNEHDFKIRRCNLATETVHPQMKAIRLLWSSEPVEPGFINPEVLVQRRVQQMGEAMIDLAYFKAGSRENPQYQSSPFYQIELEGELYSEIDPYQEKYRFPIFADLADLGCRAYFGLRLQSCAGYQQTISFATDCEQGFDRSQLDDVRWCMKLFTLLLDTRMEHEVKTTLAHTYLGSEPGRLVLNGMITPGDVKSLEAAIWFSDLRGFTRLSRNLNASELVAELNRYFTAVVDAVNQHSGEVLKFIGDAVLAVFPVSQFGDSTEACQTALAAARDAGTRLSQINAERDATGKTAMVHGIALHHGIVQFGNIGTLQRLDFTVVGAEVNLTSRIGDLCGQLGEEILCSESLSHMIDMPMRSLGQYSLKGISEPVKVFVPDPN
jgi:adenylate cyclase